MTSGEQRYTPPSMYRIRVPLVLCLFALCSAIGTAQNANTAIPKQTVAVVGGQTIYDSDLAVEGQLQLLRSQEYEIKRKALDPLIEQKLLENAAKEKGITTEQLLHQEVDAKVQDPSDDEIKGYYLAQSARLNRPLDDALKAQLRQAVRQAQMTQ